MQKQISIVGMALAIITLALCGCTQDNALSGLEYTDRSNGFGLNPPEGWTTNENPMAGPVAFMGPTEDGFPISLGVTGPTALDAGKTLQATADEAMEFLRSYSTNFSIDTTNNRTVNGMNAYEYIYTFTQDPYSLKLKQVMIEKDSKVFVLTYGAPIDSYETYLGIVEESINSFTIV